MFLVYVKDKNYLGVFYYVFCCKIIFIFDCDWGSFIVDMNDRIVWGFWKSLDWIRLVDWIGL